MNTNENQNVVEIDLAKLMRFYLEHWKALVLSCLALALASFLFTFFLITPLYRANVTVYVNNTKSSQSVDAITGGNLSAAQQLVNTYVNIIRSNTVLNKVIETAGLDCSTNELRKIMTAKQIENTEMFTVSILHPDPELAAHIANTIADVAPDLISEVVEGSSTKIIDHAQIPAGPDSPSYPKNVAIGGLLGLLISGLVLTLRYMFDMRLQDEEDIQMYFKAPVLGSIPNFNQDPSKRRSGYAAYGYSIQSDEAEGRK